MSYSFRAGVRRARLHIAGLVRASGCAVPGAALGARVEGAAAGPGSAGVQEAAVRPGAQAAVQSAYQRAAPHSTCSLGIEP